MAYASIHQSLQIGKRKFSKKYSLVLLGTVFPFNNQEYNNTLISIEIKQSMIRSLFKKKVISILFPAQLTS
jgi:hypothetical protein